MSKKPVTKKAEAEKVVKGWCQNNANKSQVWPKSEA